MLHATILKKIHKEINCTKKSFKTQVHPQLQPMRQQSRRSAWDAVALYRDDTEACIEDLKNFVRSCIVTRDYMKMKWEWCGIVFCFVMCGIVDGCSGRQCVSMVWGIVSVIWWWVIYLGGGGE